MSKSHQQFYRKNQFEPILNFSDLHHILILLLPSHPSLRMEKLQSLPIIWYSGRRINFFKVGSYHIYLRRCFCIPLGFTHHAKSKNYCMNLQKSNLSVAAYLRQVRMIINELEAMGTILDRGTIKVAIFNNVGMEFWVMVAALSMQGVPTPWQSLKFD